MKLIRQNVKIFTQIMFDLSNNNVKKLLPSCAKHCFSQVAASVTNLIRFLSGVARLCDS